jgi:hypothetical protein
MTNLELSLKLRQTNWNVARITANVVVDELPSQIIVYSCLTIDIWTQRGRCTSMQVMRFRAFHTKWRASRQVGAKSCQLYYGHPQLAGKCLVRTMQCTQFHAKSAKNDLKPTDFLKRNFCFETEQALNLKIFIQDSQVHGGQHFIQHGVFQALPEGKRNQNWGQHRGL